MFWVVVMIFVVLELDDNIILVSWMVRLSIFWVCRLLILLEVWFCWFVMGSGLWCLCRVICRLWCNVVLFD